MVVIEGADKKKKQATQKVQNAQRMLNFKKQRTISHIPPMAHVPATRSFCFSS